MNESVSSERTFVVLQSSLLIPGLMVMGVSVGYAGRASCPAGCSGGRSAEATASPRWCCSGATNEEEHNHPWQLGRSGEMRGRDEVSGSSFSYVDLEAPIPAAPFVQDPAGGE